MRGDCPDCVDSRLLARSGDGERVVGICSRCLGAWFDGVDWSWATPLNSEAMRANARFAMGRCVADHAMSRDAERCLECDAAAARCPACEAALARVIQGGTAVDVCPSCGGAWLQEDQIEPIAGVDVSALGPFGGLGGEGIRLRPQRSSDPFRCSRCERTLTLGEAAARDGLVYCGACFAESGPTPSRWRRLLRRLGL